MDYKNAENLTEATGTASTGPRHDKFDKQGNPISLEEWAQLLEDREGYPRILKTECSRYVFSTVWLGLDHSFGDGPPLIFESMAFKKDDTKRNGVDASGIYQARYTTLTEAKFGHYLMILIVLWKESTAFLWDAGNRFIKAIKSWYKQL